MALLLKNGALFLHVPKTGGSFIQHVLHLLDLVQNEVGDHNSHDRVFWHDRFHHDDKAFRNLLRRALHLTPRIPANGFRFCFVREPLSWYVSYWRFMEGRNWRLQGDEQNPYHWNPLEMMNGLGSPDFNEFIFNVNRKRPGYVTELYSWYARPSTSFVGKFETLLEDLQKVLLVMNVDVASDFLENLPPINESPCHIAQPEWDPMLRQKTLQLEYVAYARYGYDPEGTDELLDAYPLGLSQSEACLELGKK